MDVPKQKHHRAARTTSLRDASESSKMEGTGSWDALEWTKIEPISRSVSHANLDFLFNSEQVVAECFLSLGNVVHKLSEVDLDWFGRVKLIDCIYNLVLLNPQIDQTMIERLLLMLKDTDYRVQLFLARRIGVLFQTWDGHEELFQDICLNFGVQLVVYSKGKVINAKEVLAAGPQPQPRMETVLITLMHLALHSEKIELEAVFMICVVSAIDPYHRELVCAILDNLSRELQYMTRMQYLEELLGSILFCWVACGVSLVALVEVEKVQSNARQLDKTPPQRLLQVLGKDMRIIVFGFRPRTKQRRVIFDALLRCTKPACLWDLYAFASGPSRFKNTSPRVRLLDEYFRLLGKGSYRASINMIESGE